MKLILSLLLVGCASVPQVKPTKTVTLTWHGIELAYNLPAPTK